MRILLGSTLFLTLKLYLTLFRFDFGSTLIMLVAFKILEAVMSMGLYLALFVILRLDFITQQA
jgi:hypothetical protein